MYIIKQDTFELIDFYQKKINYTIIFVSNKQKPFLPAGEYLETRTKFRELGFDFNFEQTDNVKVIFNYDEINVGKIAHVSHLISKTEIENLSNMIYAKYMELVESDICDVVAEINMSKTFFDNLEGNSKPNNIS